MNLFSDGFGYISKDFSLCTVYGKSAAKRFLSALSHADGEVRRKALVLCDGEAERIFEDSNGYVPDVVNVYRAAALSLVWKYAPAAFFNASFSDYSSATVKEGKNAEIAFIGSDGYTEEIFKAIVSTFVIMEKKGGRIQGKKVKYTFYTHRHENSVCERLPYTVAVRALEMAEGLQDYYEVPEPLADIRTAEEEDFFRETATGGDMFVWAIVAGGDAEKAKKAEAMLRKRNVAHAVIYASDEDGGKDGLYTFDSTEKCVGFYMRMMRAALFRDCVYDAAKEKEECFLKALEERKERLKNTPKVKRESNLYAVVALRGLLMSVGFDCAEGGVSAEKEFNRVCDFGNPRVRDDRGAVVYDNATCAREGLRHTLAFREHLRWNEYMFSCGVGPASRNEHLRRDKNLLLAEGKHINVTTWKGLEDYRRDEAARRGTDEESTDVQRYDFQLADQAVALLSVAGYNVVVR